MPVAESRHADELRAKGFKKIDGIVINRAMRRKLLAAKVGPTFSQMSDVVSYTFATDETHQSWMASGLIDLTYLGFKNNTSSSIDADLHAFYEKAKRTYH